MTPPPCLKIPFASRSLARVAAGKTPGQKVYRCAKCGYWHMSSKTPSEIRRARKRGGYD